MTPSGLVDYSSSSSDDEQEQKETLSSSFNRPVLPQSFHDLYQTPPRIENDEFHQGRVRTVPHVSGLWPTHVYIEWIPNDAELKILNQVNNSLSQQHQVNDFESLVQSSLGAKQRLHISLSDTIMLKESDREEFVEQIKALCSELSKSGGYEGKLTGHINLLLNQTLTRGFFAALIITNSTTSDQQCILKQLAKKVYKIICTDFGDTNNNIMDIVSPHVSIASGKPIEQQQIDHDHRLRNIVLDLSTIKVKTGRTIYSFSLNR